MADYKAGNLQVALTALDDNVVGSIDTVISHLNNLATAVTAVTKDDTKWITALGTRLTNLSKKMNALDWTSLQTGFSNLATAVTPFIDKISSAKEELVALSKVTQTMTSKRALKNLSDLDSSDDKTAKKSKKSLFNLLSWGKVIVLSRQLAKTVSSLVQYGVDYTETLNKWQVAMKGNLDQAEEFVQKMNKAYGISQETLMNAQSTFKNMIGSLGNISDAASYALSESITQMALDFSSLYNTTFENAIEKFEAVLAGQVRPIRSQSGYDITDNTLYQVYKELGGTKTQRQLNRTEKQLLAIYAVFQQMQRSGAVGDLSKTLDNFSNQSRMMTENFKELQTYIGLFFEELLSSWGVMKYINAGLIFATELVKAMVNYDTPDFLQGMFESTTAENDALDELQGKLLDFDKFRALNSSTDSSAISIDQTVLDALSSYSSILNDVNNEARNLAETWLKATGIMDDNGEIVTGRVDEIKEKITALSISIGAIASALTAASLVNFASKLLNITNAAQLLNIAIVGGLIYAITRFVQLIKDGDANGAILAGTISVGLVGALVALNSQLVKISFSKFLVGVKEAITSLTTLQSTLLLVSAAASYLIFTSIFETMDEEMRKTASTIGIITGALITLAGAIAAVKIVASGGSALPSLLAAAGGLGIFMASINAKIPRYAMGASDIDSGTMFVAGESGRTEAVYTGSNGKTNVANIKQMNQAFNGALSTWWRTARNDLPQFKEVSKTGIYEINKSEMKRRGEW